MPNTNDLPTDSAVSQLTSDLCRELYDRFAMGGWMPQDAHAQTEAMIQQRFDTPAADAGPRQPSCPVCKSQMIDVRLCLSCGTNHGLSLLSNRGHKKSPCSNAWHDAPPVPQEAAPRLPSGLSKGAGYKTLGAFPVPCATNSSEQATAPDWAMRAALEIVPSVHENYAFDDTLPEREAVYAHVAALIREAGSERLEQSQKFAAQLESNIKFLNERVEAGSERERELEGKLRRSYELAHIFAKKIAMLTLSEKSYDEYSSALKELAEASRLLGGEAK